MHISIADELKKRFHAACAIRRGLKMSQVVAELIEQWLKANETFSGVASGAVAFDKVAKS